MGGDQIVPALAGEEIERELGEAIRSAEKALFLSMIEEVRVLRGSQPATADAEGARTFPGTGQLG